MPGASLLRIERLALTEALLTRDAAHVIEGALSTAGTTRPMHSRGDRTWRRGETIGAQGSSSHGIKGYR